MELIKADDFNQAKFKIAEDNNINANNFNIEFYRDEFGLFVSKYLLANGLQHVKISLCNSPHCVCKDQSSEVSVIPDLDFTNIERSDWISSEVFKSLVNDRFTRFTLPTETRCGLYVNMDSLPNDKWSYWDENKSSG